jgi:hypothetical protein
MGRSASVMRRFALCGMALAMAAGVLALAPARVMALSGEQFNGTSPYVTGCSPNSWSPAYSDIHDPNNWSHIVGRIELRYSTTCFTAWGRVQNLTGGASWVASGIVRNGWSVSYDYNLGPADTCKNGLYGYTFCRDYVANGKWSYGYQINDMGGLRAFALGYICYGDSTCQISNRAVSATASY